jgi:ribosome maturation factor RimP
MIDKTHIRQLTEAFIEDSDHFITDIRVSPDNGIVVEIDSFSAVDIDYCAELNRYIESQLDREAEDFDLEVGSAGLGYPFKVVQQYVKNIGNEVEVLTRDGKKLTGILKAADNKNFTVVITKQVKPEGAKRKITVEEDTTFTYEEIKHTKYLIRFK